MKLGCGYSRPLVQLVAEGRVHIAFIKLSRSDIVEVELERARPLKPVALHLALHAEDWSDPLDVRSRSVRRRLVDVAQPSPARR